MPPSETSFVAVEEETTTTTTKTTSTVNGNGISHPSSTSTSASSTTKIASNGSGSRFLVGFGFFRTLVLDVPLLLLFVSVSSIYLLQALYNGPFTQLLKSFDVGSDMDDFGFYPTLDTDITYYNRQCTVEDVSTQNANDLLIHPDYTQEDATHVMMKHGAVVMKDVLSKDTSVKLREYLETRNQIQDQLSWFEKFWGEIGRLALGLGASDHPIIAQALYEVGTNPTVRKTITGIMGDDPAIVEISTLNAMYQCDDQGIHTDSDYFGSSLLYSRTFLHSYTMFMALQDTTPKMGATTICPGTHWCANEDLEDVCLSINPQNNMPYSFEASSNGQTGKDVGLLYQGDAMMFNQNVWHRGPRNFDPDYPNTNRVMFIITFVSRRQEFKGDVRQQGMGTYYYQRWNMWGHTYNDLKYVLDKYLPTFRQPIAALKALGIYKYPNSHWGIPYIEHWARQQANRMDFFTKYELRDMIDKFISKELKLPRTLQGPNHEWNMYIIETLRKLFNFVLYYYEVGVVCYVTLHVVGIIIGYFMSKRKGTATSAGTNATTTATSNFAFLKRLVLWHMGIGLVGVSMYYGFLHCTYLGTRIKNGEIFRTPFPNLPVDYYTSSYLQHTTVPHRMDYLIGSRFDTPYLESFNHMLDYHPGNEELNELIEEVANMKPALPIDLCIPAILQEFDYRMLQQDYATGYWIVMNDTQTREKLRQLIIKHRNRLVDSLDNHLLEVLADSRFGRLRETVLAKQHTPWFVNKWQRMLFESSNSKDADFKNELLKSKAVKSRKASGIVIHRSVVLSQVKSSVPKLPLSPSVIVRNLKPSSSDMRPIVQGDEVRALYLGRKWSDAIVTKAHPFGTYDVQFTADELKGKVQEFVESSHVRLKPSNTLVEVNTRVMANYNNEGQWFGGIVVNVHKNPDGTSSYAVAYDDDDFEDYIPRERIIIV